MYHLVMNLQECGRKRSWSTLRCQKKLSERLRISEYRPHPCDFSI